jgi:hypothetical protein
VNQETLSLAGAELRRQSQAQLERWRHIETKATVFLGLFAVMVSVTIGQWMSAVPWGYPYLQLLGVVTLLGTLAAIMLSLWPRDMHMPPDPGELVKHLSDSPEQVEVSIAIAIQRGYAKNEAAIVFKTRCLKVTYCLLAVDVVVVTLPFVVKTVSPPWR